MNHFFRLVFNRNLNRWVVVSELAVCCRKSAGRSARVGPSVLRLAGVVLGLLSTTQALAACKMPWELVPESRLLAGIKQMTRTPNAGYSIYWVGDGNTVERGRDAAQMPNAWLDDYCGAQPPMPASQHLGVFSRANNGGGGNGGGVIGDGGRGGRGGDGSNIFIGVLSDQGRIALTHDAVMALKAHSIGGTGGDGGHGGTLSGSGGAGGLGGNGGAIAMLNAGTLSTIGKDSAAMFGMSEGGFGGRGGGGSWTPWSSSGHGGAGGNSGAMVTASNLGTISTQGNASDGIHAISVGGNGGAGGVRLSGTGVAIGGNGGGGGQGGNVLLLNEGTITTRGAQSDALSAQSVGGGGGDGGWATAAGAVFSFAMGGEAGSGGSGKNIGVHNKGSLSTSGSDAVGMRLQSIGGGGGSGGRSFAVAAGMNLASAVSIGGTGGTGGNGDVIQVLQEGGSIVTGAALAAHFEKLSFLDEDDPLVLALQGDSLSAARSYGILAQSLGGGGGAGGGAVAVSAVGGVGATFASAFTLGGKGGNGGDGRQVQIDSKVLGSKAPSITTYGSASQGIVAQSIGGGGGTGGDTIGVAASASSSKLNGNLTLNLGGSGGSGGNGGVVQVLTAGGLSTWGHLSDAVLAQSIGGGGGAGGSVLHVGAGIGSSAYVLGVNLGGTGGSGGRGNDVKVNANIDASQSKGTITTRGDFATGIKAQSVGGGGGNGGAVRSYAVALQAGEGMAGVGSVNLGGRGGSGGLGGKVTVNYGGNLTTFGNQSQGILAQSIGGGGGSGGWVSTLSLGLSLNANVAGDKGGALVGNFSLGGQGGSGNHGDSVNLNLGSQAHILTHGIRAGGAVAQSIGGGGGDGAMSQSFTMAGSMFSLQAVKDALSPAYYLRDKFIKQSKTNKEKGQTSYNFNGNIGGTGGAGGNGGTVTLALSGKLDTVGNMSHAVFAQSIGGGGGSGGAALSTGAEGVGAHSLGLSLGGKGGGGGNGGRIALGIGSTVANISTQGDAAYGMLAQSIGGGGGEGGLALASNVDYTAFTSGKTFSFSLGGAGGTGGAGGEVRVYNAASVTTQGTNANGIVAQSVGGGGGVAGSAGTPSATFNVTMGGSGNAGGNSAPVYVGAFTVGTKGDNAIGVLAQSIGGGGGLAGMGALGDSGLKVQVSLGGRGGAGGQSDRVNIGCLAEYSELAGCAGRVRTEGKLAHGIVAQSIGGGGGLVQAAVQAGANVTAVGQLTLDLSSLPFVPESTTYHGASGRVMLRDLGHSRIQIETFGDGAAGLLAQSLDGGGGVVSASGFKQPLGLNFSGQLPAGTGKNGGVDLGLNGSITTHGAYAYGIYAQALNGAQTVFTGNRQAEVRGGSVVANGDIDIRLRSPSVISASGTGAHGIVGLTNAIDVRSAWVQRMLVEGKVQASGKGAWAVRAQNGFATQVRSVNDGFMFVDVSGSIAASNQAEGGVAMLNYNGGRNAISVRAGGSIALQRADTAPACGVNECLTAQMFSPSINEVSIYQGGSITGGTVNLYGPVAASGSFAGNYVNLEGLLSAAPSRDAAGDARVYDQWGLRLDGSNNEVEIAASGELRGGLIVNGQRARLVNRGLIIGNVHGDTLVYTNSGRHVVQISGKGNSQPAIKTNYMGSSSQATLHVELTELPSSATGARPFDLVVTTNHLGLGSGGITSGAATRLDYSVTDKKVTVNKVEVDYDAWGKNPGLRSAIAIAEAQSNSGEYPSEAPPDAGAPAGINSYLYDYLLDMANETKASTVEASLQNFSLGYADAELSLAAAWYTANHLQSCGDSRLATSSAIEQGSCSWAKISYDDMQLGGGAQRGYAWGFNSGWQRELGGGFYAGASAGYGRTNFANRGISDAEGHRVSLGGILKYVNGNVFGAASLIGGYTWGDGTRSVRVPGGASQAESEHETWLLSARVRGGYNFDFGRGFSVTPSLDMNLPVIHDRGYREQGAGEFNMEVLSSTNLVPDLYPALQFGKQFRLGKASVRNWVEVGSRIRLNDLNSEVRLPDGFTPNTITHIGYRPDRSSTLWSAGLLLEWSERMELRVIYEEENGSSIRSRGGDLKLAWKF